MSRNLSEQWQHRQAINYNPTFIRQEETIAGEIGKLSRKRDVLAQGQWQRATQGSQLSTSLGNTIETEDMRNSILPNPRCENQEELDKQLVDVFIKPMSLITDKI